MAGGPDESRILKAVVGGEERLKLLADFFDRHRKRLRSTVDLRLDLRLRERVDPSALLDETLAEAGRRLDDYLRAPRIPLFLWLHSIAAGKVRDLHRQHIPAHHGSARREISLAFSVLPEASPGVLAGLLLAREGPPGGGAPLEETRRRLLQELEGMGTIDREILAMKHFERLTNPEASLVLNVPEAAIGHRYSMALRRLKGIIAAGGGTEPPAGPEKPEKSTDLASGGAFG